MTQGTAVVSDDGLYRYQLTRRLPYRAYEPRTLSVIMTNPSTAAANTDDPTITKLIGIAVRHEYTRIVVGNLYAYRATEVKDLKKTDDPIGPDNYEWLKRIIGDSAKGTLLFAWGATSKLPFTMKTPRPILNQWLFVARMAERLEIVPMCLGMTVDGHPKHPVRLAYDTKIVPWVRPATL